MERIGPYALLEELGHGAAGRVHRARDERTGALVALKLLAVEGLGARKRFEREAQALVRLRHPNVIRVLDAGETRGTPWIALELLEGGSLEDRLAREGPPPLLDGLRFGAALAGGLAHCHAGGVLHRDLKPANVLLRGDGSPVLTDFGLTRDANPATSQSAITIRGRFLGTPGFWSPEQAEGAEVEAPSDVYGLGATLYTLLAGRPPHVAETLIELVAASREPPPPPSRWRPELPPAVDRLLLACLAREPEVRPTAAAVAETLSALGQVDSGALRAPRVERRRSWPVGLSALLLLCAAASLGVAALWLPASGVPLPAAPRPRVPAPDAPPPAPAPVVTPPTPPEPAPIRTPAPTTPQPLPGLRQGDGGEWLHALPDGSELRMVWVPPGSFRMGGLDHPNWQPEHEARIAAGFYLSKHEVTWKQYRAFAAAMGEEPPPHAIEAPGWTPRFEAGDEDPVFNVSWEDARAFCAWAGLRLPSEAEWEWAARGPERRRFPWGDRFPRDGQRVANVADESAGPTAPPVWSGPWSIVEGYDDGHLFPARVGSFPAGASWCGAEDLSGNLMEWTEDAAAAYEPAPRDAAARTGHPRLRVVRGGNWCYGELDCQGAARGGLDRASRGPMLGFRVARSE